jgi:hypothetical protein
MVAAFRLFSPTHLVPLFSHSTIPLVPFLYPLQLELSFEPSHSPAAIPA